MKKALLFVLVTGILGCSTTGNIIKTDKKNIYTILVHSNAFSSPQKIEAMFENKAVKACQGGEYAFEGITRSEISEIKTYGDIPTSTSVLSKRRTLVCK